MLKRGEFVGKPEMMVGRDAYVRVGGEFRRCRVERYCPVIGKNAVNFFGHGRAYLSSVYM